MIKAFDIELNITDEDRNKGYELAQLDIQNMAHKLEAGEITYSQFIGYIWEMRILCNELIDNLAEEE